MKDPSAPMQAAIYAKLTASSGLAAAMGGAVRAYDKIPPAPVAPSMLFATDVGDLVRDNPAQASLPLNFVNPKSAAK